MKTSVIEVHDMLAVLSVDDVEQRISEVPGVDSVTVNYAATPPPVAASPAPDAAPASAVAAGKHPALWR